MKINYTAQKSARTMPREAERHEASERHKPDVAAASQQHVRSKRIAEASALALALVEEIAQSENVLPDEREKQALQDKVMRAENNAERKRKARSKVAPGEKDITNAASAFRAKRARLVKRAEQGNAEAQFKLGVMHLDGQYRGDVVATVWFQKAAEQGHAGAQNNLGFMYSKAVVWRRISVRPCAGTECLPSRVMPVHSSTWASSTTMAVV